MQHPGNRRDLVWVKIHGKSEEFRDVPVPIIAILDERAPTQTGSQSAKNPKCEKTVVGRSESVGWHEVSWLKSTLWQSDATGCVAVGDFRVIFPPFTTAPFESIIEKSKTFSTHPAICPTPDGKKLERPRPSMLLPAEFAVTTSSMPPLKRPESVFPGSGKNTLISRLTSSCHWPADKPVPAVLQRRFSRTLRPIW